MQRTPPHKLPSRPPLTVGIYKTLPDASNANLPLKPPITPTSLSPTSFRFPQPLLTPSLNKTSRRQKRTYSQSNDNNVVVPLQQHPARDSTKIAPYSGAGYDGVGEVKHQSVLLSTIADSHNNNNNGTTCNYNKPSPAAMVHQQPPNITRPTKLQLIHDMLLQGAKTLTTSDQDYLTDQLHENLPCISALFMWLVAKQVTNKTHNLSYGVIHWAHNNKEHDLMEYMLTDRLYGFDMEEAFDEGLMGIKEVMDLMDCQMVLRCVRMERKERLEKAQKKMVEHTKTNASRDADHCESDLGSADMDLSEEDS